jgi:hypothetical protein
MSPSQSTRIHVLLAAALSLGGACGAEELTDEQGDDEAVRGFPISTRYYDGGLGREICATGHPQGTYYVAITAKEWDFGNGAGPCKNFTERLDYVEPNQIDWEFCAHLGLQHGVNGCWSNAAPNGLPLYCYTFSKWYEQVNYNVVDWVGHPAGTSGWQPPGGNGCPRGGFMW